MIDATHLSTALPKPIEEVPERTMGSPGERVLVDGTPRRPI
jgi:hypothetical protein